jgi:hypothetical protein
MLGLQELHCTALLNQTQHPHMHCIIKPNILMQTQIGGGGLTTANKSEEGPGDDTGKPIRVGGSTWSKCRPTGWRRDDGCVVAGGRA